LFCSWLIAIPVKKSTSKKYLRGLQPLVLN
jgi:hypothetical protein